ncbi:MAG TPA: polyprenol monophosphomannose synthase [Acidimicrobiia bacterium]
MQPDRVTVVVPTYNEIENLADLVTAVTTQGFRLLVVDDGSPDGTGALADELAGSNPLVSVMHRTSKQGLGPAYAAAFDHLLGGGSTDVVIEMDADFSHDPADLPRLVEAIDQGADLAIGSRYVEGGATPDWPAIRRLISRGGNLYSRLMLGHGISDSTAGFRAFRAEALTRLPYREARASGYGFQVEMAWRASREGLRITEVPVVFRDRTRGTSKMGGKIVLEAMWLVTLWGLRHLPERLGLKRR